MVGGHGCARRDEAYAVRKSGEECEDGCCEVEDRGGPHEVTCVIPFVDGGVVGVVVCVVKGVHDIHRLRVVRCIAPWNVYWPVFETFFGWHR